MAEFDVAGEEVDEHALDLLVFDLDGREPERFLVKFAADKTGVRHRSIGSLVALLLQRLGEIIDGLVGALGRDDLNEGHLEQGGDVFEIVHRIIVQGSEEGWRCGQNRTAGRNVDGIAIRLCARDEGRGDVAKGAGLVIDDDGFADHLGEPV